MITLSNNTKGLALLHQVEEIYGKVYTSDSLLETVLYWGMNCTPGPVAQSVTCLATDACLTADPGVASSITVRSHTFVEIDH